MKVAIIGMNLIGASLGLALSNSGGNFTCVGYDKTPALGKAAKQAGAISQFYPVLSRSIKDARVIILACSLDQVKRNLSVIARHAPSGSLIIDTSSVKTPVAQWAQEILPDDMTFAGWTLALNATEINLLSSEIKLIRKDLFANSMIGVSISPETSPEVLKFCCELVSLLGATPFFVDQVEADGLLAMSHDLPRVAALALLLTTVDTPGWPDAQKIAGSDFASATSPILRGGLGEDPSLAMRLNRDNLARLVGDLIHSLERIQTHLEGLDHDALKADLAHAMHQRELWLAKRTHRVWETSDQGDQPQPERPSLLGGWLDSKLKKGKDTQE